MGGAIEGIYMGVSNIGGSTPADPCPATIIAVAYSILTGSDIATGVMLSLPIGTLMQSFTNILTPFYASLSVYWEKLAASGNTKKMGRQVVLFDLFLQRIAQMLVLFLSIAYGIEGIQTVFNSLPGWVLNGFNAASGMMTAHEGHKIEIKDNSMREWKEIRLEDGKVGWIPASAIEVI